MLAWARHAESDNFDIVVANNEVPGIFISSLAGIEFTDESPKKLVSYYAVVYGIDYDSFYETIDCESGFRHEGLFGDSGKAYGIMQFHKPTFDQFCKGNYKNLEDQLECGARMFSQNLQSHWTCYKHDN